MVFSHLHLIGFHYILSCDTVARSIDRMHQNTAPEHLWNVSVLQRVLLSNILIDILTSVIP
jgi:hypothetical protein